LTFEEALVWRECLWLRGTRAHENHLITSFTTRCGAGQADGRTRVDERART
jgi:hypothetical protein